VKYKSLILVLVLFLSAPLAAQDGVYEWVTHKPMGKDTPGFNIQIAKGEKVGAVLTSCWAISDYDESQPVNEIDINWVDLNAEDVVFLVNYTALYSTKVRFRMIITGPTFYMRTSNNWHDAKYKTNSLYAVGFDQTSHNALSLKKGEYTVAFIAELQKPFGGSECVASTTFRVY